MKLLKGIVILYGLAFAKDNKSYYCDSTELDLPTHANEWLCTGETGSLVPAGKRCQLKCAAGYVPTMCKLSVFC